MYCCCTVTCVVSGSGGQVRRGGVSIRKDGGPITVTTRTYLQSTQHDSGTHSAVYVVFLSHWPSDRLTPVVTYAYVVANNYVRIV